MTFETKNAARHEHSMSRLVARTAALIERAQRGEVIPHDEMIDPDQLSMLERAGNHGHRAVSRELAADAKRVAAEYIRTVMKKEIADVR